MQAAWRVAMKAPWPPGFERVPDEDWTQAPVESLARKYDRVDAHGWYSNLDFTVEELARFLGDDGVALDYSGGTGLLIGRLLEATRGRGFGVVNVDSSPKFLRLSLEKFRGEERVAFRLIRYLREERRLQYVDEVLGKALVERRVDAIASANAIHLYHDLVPTLRSWRRVLRDDGRAFVQSGNVRTPLARQGHWVIDDTVAAVDEAARRIVREDDRYAAHRPLLADAAWMRAHDEWRRRVFPPVRPLDEYVRAFDEAGLEVVDATVRPIEARAEDWYEFLAVYHEGVLGWVGGAEKVTGRPADGQAVRDRLGLLREGLDRALGGKPSFLAAWTYLTCAPIEDAARTDYSP